MRSALRLTPMKTELSLDELGQRIYFIRGRKVMLDADLAILYQVKTKVLNQAVRRNLNRFPDDFMFEISLNELENLRSHFVTSSLVSYGGRRYSHLAFTEQGIAMLSGVLKSERAVHVNVAIMRTFVRLRELLGSNKELAKRLDDLEKKYDQNFKVVFDAIRALVASDTPPTQKRIRGLS